MTLTVSQSTWLIKDTSTNGTFVNNTRVGKGNEAPLRVGDVLRLSQAVGEKNKLIECATVHTATCPGMIYPDGASTSLDRSAAFIICLQL